jgi:hypothetical protein
VSSNRVPEVGTGFARSRTDPETRREAISPPYGGEIQTCSGGLLFFDNLGLQILYSRGYIHSNQSTGNCLGYSGDTICRTVAGRTVRLHEPRISRPCLLRSEIPVTGVSIKADVPRDCVKYYFRFSQNGASALVIANVGTVNGLPPPLQTTTDRGPLTACNFA